MLKSKLTMLMAAVSFTAITSMTGCVSTPVSVSDSTIDSTNVSTTDENLSSTEHKNITVIEESSSAEDDAFINSIKDISIKIISSPRYGSVGNDFVRPFTIKVADAQGEPKADFPISIRYPSGKENGELVFATENVKTDDNGQYVFTAPTLSFSGFTDFVVYPTPVSNKKSVTDAITEKSAMTPWDVRSDLAAKGCLLVVWDFNELDKFDRNSSQIQGELRSRGIYNVGNAPYSDSSYINKSVQSIYEANKEIVGGTAYGYLIYGTIKFTTDVTPLEEGGYTCTLLGDIQAIRMNDGSIALHKTVEQSAVGKNWNEVVSKCKNKLASKLVDSLLYDLN